MGDLIEVGDEVTVRFDNYPPISGKVLHVPGAEGDCFHIRTDEGMLVYVQRFEFMEQDRR